MNTATIKNWFLLDRPFESFSVEIKDYFRYFVLPANVRAQLFGETYNDSRHDPETGEFADGHRIHTRSLTSFVLKDELREAVTYNSVYTLEDIHSVYADWLAEQNYMIADTYFIYQNVDEEYPITTRKYCGGF